MSEDLSEAESCKSSAILPLHVSGIHVDTPFLDKP